MQQPPWQELRPRVLATLKEVFGYDSFRGVQEEAVKAALQGRDTLVLMPTGGGKSMCYALPAAVTGGLVLVVSPLIALMHDQVSALQAAGLAADYLSSTRSAAERQAILDLLTPAAATAAMAAGSNGSSSAGSSRAGLALLYVTPELIATDSFRQRLQELHSKCPGYVKSIAVDEAHCISSWGHDYRPTYRQLSKLRSVLKGVPCMALTATATAQVQEDIIASLKLKHPAVLSSSFNRPNIHYTILLLDVQPAPRNTPSSSAAAASNTHDASTAAAAAAGAAAAAAAAGARGDYFGDDGDDLLDDADHAGYQHLLQLLKPSGRSASAQRKAAAAAGALQQQQQGQQQNAAAGGTHRWPGPIAIVYALKRATVDALARRLSGEGLAVAAYHAALPASRREEVLMQWRAGQLQVVVASVAFGMGVDKGDIELVVHYNLPRSVEGFYQESGRAGRNGQPARSVLMYACRDRRRMDYILQKDAEKKAKRKRKQQPAAAAAAATASSTDPVVAAAALRAFGRVVELCLTAGCRRQQLLSHFGEALPPQQSQQQQQQQQQPRQQQRVRCCDFCDNAAQVAAVVEQQRLLEQQMVQRRFGRGGASAGSSRKRRKGAAEGFGYGGSSEEEDEGESGSSDGPDEASYEVAAAVAAAKQRAAGGRAAAAAAAGGAGPKDTGAFVAAMLQAEQAHERKAAAAGGGASDRLEQLLTARRGKGQQQTLSQDIRSSRRSKLAAAIVSNTRLQGCSQQAASQLAVDYEAAAAAESKGDAGVHKARMQQLLARSRAATGLLELPELQLLTGAALEAALRHGTAEAVAAAQQCSAQPQQQGGSGSSTAVARAELLLTRLGQLSVTTDALEATGVAKAVKVLRKHAHAAVAAAATHVINAWRQAVTNAG